jgi:hypothetical protein
VQVDVSEAQDSQGIGGVFVVDKVVQAPQIGHQAGGGGDRAQNQEPGAEQITHVVSDPPHYIHDHSIIV